MTSKYLIYGLAHPRSPDIVMYVGRSSSGLRRPNSHMNPSVLREGKTPKDGWLRSLAADGLRPQVLILEEVAESAALVEAGPRWIIAIRAQNPELKNVDPGGYPGPQSRAHRDAISRAHKTAGHRPTPDAARKSISSRAEDPDYRAKMVKAKGGRPFRDQNGNLYQSIQGAARQLGLSPGNIHRVLHPGKYHYKAIRGFIFTFVSLGEV